MRPLGPTGHERRSASRAINSCVLQKALAFVPYLFLDGFMQAALSFGQSADLVFVRDRLRDRFGPQFDAQRHDPISQLVKAAISSRTYDEISSAAFERLVMRYPDVGDLAAAPVEEIEAVISNVEFAESKATHLRAALRMVKAQQGAISLDFLLDWPVDLAMRWLVGLPGVGHKVAAAVLNFSTLRRRIFVVDTHVLRVLQRFGFVGTKADYENASDAVMAAADSFDTDDLYELHWLLKYLGQQICTHGMRALQRVPPCHDVHETRAPGKGDQPPRFADRFSGRANGAASLRSATNRSYSGSLSASFMRNR
jgi:endonuclease III